MTSISDLNSQTESSKRKLCLFQNTVHGFLTNPIQSGYLLEFCKDEHITPNLKYILEVHHFKELCEDPRAWRENISYREIDLNIGNFGSIQKLEKDLVLGEKVIENYWWPSVRIPRSYFIETVKMIWDKYFSVSSPHHLSFPDIIVANTIQRIENINLYGPKVFDETLIDPMENLKLNVIPRFLNSPHYKAMRRRLQDLSHLPFADSLRLSPPESSLCLEWEDKNITEDKLREVNMFQLFHDRTIYEEFLKYSQSIHAKEIVYLARALCIFKSIFTLADPAVLASGKAPPGADDQAWLIFRYFIASDSAYEVSGLSYRSVKKIMLKLANPEFNMFDKVEDLISNQVYDQYMSFSNARSFRELPARIFKKKKLRQSSSDSSSSRSKYILSNSSFGYRTTFSDITNNISLSDDNSNSAKFNKSSSKSWSNIAF